MSGQPCPGSTLIAPLIERWNTRSTATRLEGDWAWRTGYGAMPIDDRIAAELTGPVPQPAAAVAVVRDCPAHRASLLTRRSRLSLHTLEEAPSGQPT
ncbi:hypothetical protein ACFV6T_18790 [Streptomyces parvus]|uniref:hypothetical protein n=2 Tax=Streptomyces parvus TaxID=66428 RepID=UPI0036A4F637